MTDTTTIEFNDDIILDNPEEVFHDLVEEGLTESEAIRELIGDGILSYILRTQYPEFDDSDIEVRETELGKYEVSKIWITK